MARPSTEHYDLTEQEKRDLIKLIYIDPPFDVGAARREKERTSPRPQGTGIPGIDPQGVSGGAARRRQFSGERTRLGCCFRRPRRKLGSNYDRLSSPNESSLTPAQSSAGVRMTAREARALPDSFFHGKTGGRLVVVGPINLPVGRSFVEEVIVECWKRGATRVDYWAVDFNYESRKEIIKMAKTMGVDGELPGVVDAASGAWSLPPSATPTPSPAATPLLSRSSTFSVTIP